MGAVGLCLLIWRLSKRRGRGVGGDELKGFVFGVVGQIVRTGLIWSGTLVGKSVVGFVQDVRWR
jgi:hypothetical protein